MKKAELQRLVDSMDTNLPVEVLSGSKLRVKIGDKVFTKDIESDAGVSQALVELKRETDDHTFITSFKPSEKASNKTDGEDGMKADKKAKEGK